MSTSPLRIGVIGVGFGTVVHIPGFQSEGIEVLAVCASREERAREAWQGPGVSSQGSGDTTMVRRVVRVGERGGWRPSTSSG